MITTINERGTVYEDGPTAGVCRAGTVSDSRLLGTAAIGSNNTEMLASLTLGKRF